MSISLLVAAVLAAQALPNLPVETVDLTRYSGKWYEIARFEQWFQKKCVADVTATYSLRPDNKINVINRCRTRDGQMTEADGVARRVEDKSSALKVSFAPKWLSWIPFVWGDYWIIDIDRNYSWALIGSPTREYLWILSRTPQLDSKTYDAIVASAKARGYAVDNLIKSDRSDEISTPGDAVGAGAKP